MRISISCSLESLMDFSFLTRDGRASVAVRLGQWVPLTWVGKDVVGDAEL